jgi:hypothetical protein
MGLDNFASRSLDVMDLTADDERAFEDAGLVLCGGIYSGEESSFRGKVYWELIYEATGVSISESITPDVVKDVSARLDAYTPGDLAELSATLAVPGQESSPDVCASLQRFFRICAERGLGLIAWG